jgi:Xaa-Pro aminopeptidase
MPSRPSSQTEMFERVRQVGNSMENLEKFADTSQIMNRVYSELEAIIRPRMTEMELAAEAHRVSRAFGFRDPMVLLQTTPFGVISFGSTKQIRKEDVLTLWIESAGPSGHWLEYRRCYTFGEPASEVKEFWQLQKSAVEAGMKKLKPGAMASEFVRTTESVLKKGGYDFGYKDMSSTHFTFSLHGIGTDAIQGVWVPGNDRVIAENEVVNIHPAIVFKANQHKQKFAWLGVTDNVMATPDGGRLMTHSEGLPDGLVSL